MSKSPLALLRDQGSGGEEIPPGLSLSKILGDIGKEVKHQIEFGSHEMAAMLFRGDAFVMYPKTGQEDQQNQGHGLPEDPQQQQENDGHER